MHYFPVTAAKAALAPPGNREQIIVTNVIISVCLSKCHNTPRTTTCHTDGPDESTTTGESRVLVEPADRSAVMTMVLHNNNVIYNHTHFTT